MGFNIVLLPGDGIGPEIVSAAVKVLEKGGRAARSFVFVQRTLDWWFAIDRTGNPLPEETVAACKASDAVLLAQWVARNGMILRPKCGPNKGCWEFARR